MYSFSMNNVLVLNSCRFCVSKYGRLPHTHRHTRRGLILDHADSRALIIDHADSRALIIDHADSRAEEAV